MILSMASLVGAPRPRVLAYGLAGEEVAILESVAGSVRVVDDLRGVYPEEHDALVMSRGQFHHFHHSFHRRLVFAPPALDEQLRLPSASGVSWGGPATQQSTNMATQFEPARDLEVTDAARELRVEGLVKRSCMPEPGANYTGFRTPVYPRRDVIPLLQEVLSKPLTLAAVLESRSNDETVLDSAIWLPDLARSTFREWVMFAFARWRLSEPERFPVSAEWKTSQRWASPEELSARRRLDAFDAEEAARREASDDERRALTVKVETAETQGERWRTLLTASDEELVSSVKEALELLGFSVQNSDELPQHKSAKREDLRVTDGSWTALVEVKGYAGAAKSNDLSQVTRAAMTYAMTEQRTPDALWYVPNLERNADPAQRAVALAGREDDLTAFADDYHGCLIDSRELFRLRQSVALGQMTAEDAREVLKAARGRLALS